MSIFRLKFIKKDKDKKKSFCHIRSNFAFFKKESLMKKQKFLNLKPKLPYFDVLSSSVKNHCQIWKQHPRISFVANVGDKIEILKLGTKNAWFAYFCAGTWNQYCDKWNQQPKFRLITTFSQKTQKCLNLRRKMPHSSLFGLTSEINIVIFQIFTLDITILREFVKCLRLRQKCLI